MPSHDYVDFNHCEWCRQIDYAERARRASLHPNYSLPDFATRYGDNVGSYSGINPKKELEKLDKEIAELRKRTSKNRLLAIQFLKDRCRYEEADQIKAVHEDWLLGNDEVKRRAVSKQKLIKEKEHREWQKKNR